MSIGNAVVLNSSCMYPTILRTGFQDLMMENSEEHSQNEYK